MMMMMMISMTISLIIARSYLVHRVKFQSLLSLLRDLLSLDFTSISGILKKIFRFNETIIILEFWQPASFKSLLWLESVFVIGVCVWNGAIEIEKETDKLLLLIKLGVLNSEDGQGI